MASLLNASTCGKLVLVLGDLLQGVLDELALHVTDGDGELVDLGVVRMTSGCRSDGG